MSDQEKDIGPSFPFLLLWMAGSYLASNLALSLGHTSLWSTTWRGSFSWLYLLWEHEAARTALRDWLLRP